MGNHKKRIALIDWDMTVTGGAEAVAAALTRSLCEEFDVYFVSIFQKNGPPAYDLSSAEKYFSLNCKSQRLRSVMWEIKKPLRKFLKENQIDVALLIGNYPAYVSIPSMIFMKTKFVYCDHGALINQIHEKAITFIRFISSLFADRIVVLTDKTRNDYIKFFCTRRSKIVTIPNWIDDRVLANAEQCDLDSKKILSVGRFGPEKGYDMMVNVAKEVLPKYPEWKWYVYGEGETFDDVKQQVIKEKLDDQLILMGNNSNVLSLYKDHSILVLPSYREGLPLVLLEAKANRLPIVSFNIDTGPCEIVRDGVNGFLIEPYNIKNMAESIEKLIKDDELRKSFSMESRLDIEKFEKKNILKTWIDFICDLVK